MQDGLPIRVRSDSRAPDLSVSMLDTDPGVYAFDLGRIEGTEKAGRVETTPPSKIVGDERPAVPGKQANLQVVPKVEAAQNSEPSKQKSPATSTPSDSSVERLPMRAAESRDGVANDTEAAATVAKFETPLSAATTSKVPRGAGDGVAAFARQSVAADPIEFQVAKHVGRSDGAAGEASAARGRPYSVRAALDRLVRLIRRHPIRVGVVVFLVALSGAGIVPFVLPDDWNSAVTYGVIGNLFATGLAAYVVFAYSLIRTSQVRRFLLARIESHSKRKGRMVTSEGSRERSARLPQGRGT